MSRRARRIWIAAGIVVGLALVLAASAILVLRSDWLRGKVRDRIVAEVEKATGGRVEIGADIHRFVEQHRRWAGCQRETGHQEGRNRGEDFFKCCHFLPIHFERFLSRQAMFGSDVRANLKLVKK